MTDVYYQVRYLGHVLEETDTLEEAKAFRRDLVRDIRAGKLPGFLDADDISGVNDFGIYKIRDWEREEVNNS